MMENDMRFGSVIIGLWIAFALSWLAAAAWADRTEKKAGIRNEWPAGRSCSPGPPYSSLAPMAMAAG
jgi:hypothetical protein